MGNYFRYILKFIMDLGLDSGGVGVSLSLVLDLKADFFVGEVSKLVFWDCIGGIKIFYVK